MTLNPGIYLGLSDEEYFNAPALSQSDIKELLKSPLRYWSQSWMNPDQKKKPVTDSMKRGKDFHLLLLEPEKFHEHYYVVPGGSYHPSKKMVKRSDYLTMKEACEFIYGLEVPGYPKGFLFDKRFGYPEVVVVWDDPVTGVRCRAKQDFFCWEWTVDYKTADSIDDDFIWKQIRWRQYAYQHVYYTRARKAVREMLKNGTADVYGDFSDKFIQEFLNARDDFFVFVFQEKEAPYDVELPLIDCEGSLAQAERDIDAGLRRWKACYEKYGTAPWKEQKKKFRSLSVFYGFNPGE